MPDTIDINISPVIETVDLTIQPNLTTINVNTVTGGGAVDSVNGQIGVVVLNQDDILDGTTYKQYSLTEKNKLAGIASGAEVNVNADWNAESGDAEILNKPTIPSITNLVPYTGATTNVDLGEFELKAGQVEFDQTPTGTAGVGVMRWNDTDGTLDLGLKGGNVTLQIGQEEVVRVVNKTATNVNLLQANYQAVRVTGAQGQRLKVDLAQATNDALSAETIGLVTETINNNEEGFITTNGFVRNINTTGSLQGETWADGDIVYLSATTAGNLTNIKPTAPNHLVIIGYVVSAHITQGTIFVKVDVGYELDELHNVAISTPLNNQALTYETSTQLWKNKTIIEDSITDGVTDKAPSQNAVFDALATKFTLPALTSGSVLFSNGTTIAQDNANLFWDDTNNRLGIGTNAPAHKLHITGSFGSYTSGLLVENTGNASDAFKNVAIFIGNRGNASNIDDNTNIGIVQKSNIVNNYGIVNFYNAGGNLSAFFGCQYVNHGSGQSGNFIIGTTNAGTPSEKMRISAAGFVGIGTTSPQARLDVRAQGALSTDIAFRVRNSADSANLITVQGNGNVGIGTATPSEALDLGSTSGWVKTAQGASNAGGVIFPFSTADANSRGWTMRNDCGAFGELGLTVSNTQTGDPKLGTIKIRITPFTNIGINGTPDAFGNYSYFSLYGLNATQGGVFIAKTSNNSHSFQLRVDSTANHLQGLNNPMIFYCGTGGSERMRISNAGNLLIGTTTDSGSKFYVAGESRFQGNIIILDTVTSDISLGTTTGTKIGTATSQKLSLWNATPNVQPTTAITASTFATNTSGILNDTATFDGYTMGQVVAALRRIGALA
jgi:uncharacterized protein YaiE (UPF0345 family)